MSYISALRQGDDVTVWERTEEGRIEKTYRAPYFFFTKDTNGEHVSIFGDKLTRHDFRNSKEYNHARSEMESYGVELFESDITPDIRVLSEHYYGKPAPILNVTFLDIEVDYNKEIGFSSVANPYAPINSIAMHHQHENRTVVYCIPPDDSWDAPAELPDELHELAEITFCEDEKSLLLYIIAEIEDSDVVCGWNSDFFDMPYIAKRIERVLGLKYLKMLSFPGAGKPRYREVEKFGNIQETIDLQGRVSVDYLNLFQKYEMAERPTYKLEAIADEVLPELPKLHYEGTLHDLYRKDFQHFIRYNIRDTEILLGFEERLGYVALANEMYHISGGLFKHVGGTLKLAELAINNYCWHNLNMRVPNVHVPDSSDSIQGAYVLQPKVGLHEWVGSIDINSLYPSSIRSINISPETLLGQFPEKVRAAEEIAKGTFVTLLLEYDDGKTEEHTADEWRNVLKERKWSVSGYGTVFNQEEKGIIPAILEEWYSTRKDYQKMKGEALDKANKVLHKYDNNAITQIQEVKTPAGEGGFDCAGGAEDVEIIDDQTPEFNPKDDEEYKKWKEKAAYYDRLQYVYKIKLNSLYGALNNQYFRFYDLRMGESTTGTGRMILVHQCAKTNELMTGDYDSKGDAIVYGDTDSTYFAHRLRMREKQS